MKQKLLAMLKTLFASKGFSPKTLEGITDILLTGNLTETSTDEEINTAIAGVTPFAELMQAENTRYANEVKSKLPKPVETPVPTPIVAPVTVEPKPEEDMPAWAKTLVTSTQALAQGLESIQKEKVGNTRKDQYTKALEGTSDVFKTKALKDFDLFNFKDDTHFDEWLVGASEDAKGFAQAEANDGLGGFKPTGSAGGAKTGEKEVSPLMKDFLTAQAAKAPKAVTA